MSYNTDLSGAINALRKSNQCEDVSFLAAETE